LSKAIAFSSSLPLLYSRCGHYDNATRKTLQVLAPGLL